MFRFRETIFRFGSPQFHFTFRWALVFTVRMKLVFGHAYLQLGIITADKHTFRFENLPFPFTLRWVLVLTGSMEMNFRTCMLTVMNHNWCKWLILLLNTSFHKLICVARVQFRSRENGKLLPPPLSSWNVTFTWNSPNNIPWWELGGVTEEFKRGAKILVDGRL